MNLLLGSVLLTGVCWLGAAVVIPVMPNFDRQRIAERFWYPLLFIPTGEAESAPFYAQRFLPLQGGGMKYSIRIPRNGECMTVEVPMDKQTQPGDYKSSLLCSLRFVETDYEQYIVVSVGRCSALRETFLVLGGSQPKLTPALEKRFKELATSLGITREILRPVVQETC